MVKGYEQEKGGGEQKANNQSKSAQKFLLRTNPAAQGSGRGDTLKPEAA